MAFPLAPAELAHAGLHAHGFVHVDLAPAELAHDGLAPTELAHGGLAPAELASDLLAPDELAPAGLVPAEQWHVAEDSLWVQPLQIQPICRGMGYSIL